MGRFGVMVGMCVCSASFAASAACAVFPAAQAGGTAKVEAVTRFAPVPVGSSDTSSDTVTRKGEGVTSTDAAQDIDHAAHLARQYALHRSSLYLYNPGRIGQMARAPGGAAVEQ